MSEVIEQTGDVQRSKQGRRSQTERRAGGDRRRNAERRTPIIHITPTMLRMLVVVERAHGEKGLAICRSIPWQVDSRSLHSPQGMAELSAALSKLASEERLAGSAAEVLLSSELCVTRAVTGVIDEVHRESASLRERSQLYLSLGPGSKVIATSSTPLDARHAHALLTVATEQTLQVVSLAVEASGMQLAGIRSAQVALVRVAHHMDDQQAGAQLVVDIDNGRVELGVMSAGRLFLDYRPGGEATVEDLADLLTQHHTRLQRYCQRHHGLKGNQLDQVVVSGPAQQAKAAVAGLGQTNQFSVRPLKLHEHRLPWELRGDTLTTEMAAAVGAALGLELEDHLRGPNLLDELISNARPPIRKMLIKKLAPLAAIFVIAAMLGAVNWEMNRELRNMQRELDILSPKAARAAELRLQLIADQAKIRQLDLLAQQIPVRPYAVLLDNLTHTVPGEVWLSSLSFDGDLTAMLAGSSYLESSIYDLVGHLQHLPGVTEVALQGTAVGRASQRDSTTFDIHLDLDFAGKAKDPAEAL